MEGPYRSENDGLRAENERLRAELSAHRVPRPGIALTLAALDLGLVVLLRPFLNGASDGGFWASLFAIGSLALLALAAAVGRRGRSTG